MYSIRIPTRFSVFVLVSLTLFKFLALHLSLSTSNSNSFVNAFITNGAHKISQQILQKGNLQKTIKNRQDIYIPFYSTAKSPCFISLNIELDEDEHDEEEEEGFEWINEDFVNPQNIAEGSTVKILTEEKFFHVPKLNKLHPEGFSCKDLEAKVIKICIENKDGVICSANRPVIVKFEEPAKFTAHFGFAELDLIE